MYWISYKAREYKPEGTSIVYSFSYLKEDGTYSEWTEDFSSLQPAKSMKVKIQTKGYKGTYPSVYSFQVYFTYNDQQDSIVQFKPVLRKNLDDTGKVINPEEPAKITYEAKIENPILDLFMPGVSIINHPPQVSYFVKEEGKTEFTPIDSLEEVKTGSTIRIIVDYPKGQYVSPEPPVVVTSPSVQVQKETPSSTSTERWDTIQTMTFVAHSGDGEKTEWLEAKIVDKQPEGTRITYEYLASQNGLSFGYRTDDIKKLPHSQSAMVIVKKMVRKDLVGKVEPELTSISLVHTKGVADLDLIRPTLAIIPKKSNNKNSEFFSTDTVVTWDYEAYDPRNKQIVDVEWRGTVLTKYTVGKYTVQARVQNERGDWSNWVSYTFEVKPEQPIAKITMTPESGVTSKTKINWGYSMSIDPDGDKIVNAEWQNQQSIYPFGGNQTVRLRVQDEEGNWSEWVEKSFYVTYITSIKTANFSIYNGIAITDEGQIMTWGKKDPNLLGYEVVADNVDYATPVILPSPLNVVEVSSSNYNVLALTSSGEVYSWGKNADGETGLGHQNEVHTPQKVQGLPPIKKVLTAYSASFAIAENGDVYGWGRNYAYKISNTLNGTDFLSPIKVNGLSNIKDIAQGSNMVVAIDNNGKTFVWGFNSNYQLGTGTTGSQTTPLLHPYLQDKQAVGLVAHDLTVSILLSNGKVMSWGDYANYGTGYATSTKVPVELVMPDVKKLVRTHYGVFTLTTDGQVYGWGRNVYGFSSGLMDIKTPQPILFSAEKVVNITGGQHGYETYLYTEQGKVYGFGSFAGLVEMKAKNSGDSKLPILTPATHTLIGQ